MPRLLGHLIYAEAFKLQSRLGARAGWVLLAVLAVLPAPVLALLSGAAIDVSGETQMVDASAANAVRWALIVRNLFIGQAFVLVLGATSLAGEYQARTLREDLLRAVPRWGILLAKWVALSGWSVVSLVVQGILAAIAGFVFLDAAGLAQWDHVLLGYTATWLTDTSIAAVVLLAAALLRSLPATIGAMFLFVVLDRVVGWMLSAGRFIRDGLPADAQAQIPAAIRLLLDASPYLPSEAWYVWNGLLDGAPPALASWGSLVVITVGAAIAAERVFARTDAP